MVEGEGAEVGEDDEAESRGEIKCASSDQVGSQPNRVSDLAWNNSLPSRIITPQTFGEYTTLAWVLVSADETCREMLHDMNLHFTKFLDPWSAYIS